MPWAYILSLIGPGLHYDKTQDELVDAIEKAESDGQFIAADHLSIILKRKVAVRFERLTSRAERAILRRSPR